MKAQHVLKEKEAGNLNTEIPTLANKRRVVPSYGLEWSAEAGSFTSDEPKETVGSLSENAEYVSSGGSLTPPPPPEPEVVQNRYTQRPQQPSATGAPKTKDEQMVDMFKLMQKMKQEEQNSIKSDKKADIPAPGGDLTKLLPNAEGSQDGKIHVSYYFSAECPYCKKFEVGFQQIIKELGSKIVVECVDMTPSAKDIVNIYGKVDCDWRPLQSGEMAKFAIKSTPTLLVQFPNKAGPERLEGNVSASNLRTYLRL
jgi:thiol-disulfide isomerase/thioredoxin